MRTQERNILLRTARETITARLENRKPEFEEPSQSLLEARALFVTLRRNGKLRGCIGTLEATSPLFEAVKDLSISSAFNDPRFPPLNPEEINALTIELSVLSPLEEVDMLDTIEVGKHGLYVKKGARTGVLLPQVPIEQGWNRTQFLQNTCRKAGLAEDAWQNGDAVFYTFTAEIFGDEA